MLRAGDIVNIKDGHIIRQIVRQGLEVIAVIPCTNTAPANPSLCIDCSKQGVFTRKNGMVVTEGACASHFILLKNRRTHKETITNLRLPHLKEYLEVIGK